MGVTAAFKHAFGSGARFASTAPIRTCRPQPPRGSTLKALDWYGVCRQGVPSLELGAGELGGEYGGRNFDFELPLPGIERCLCKEGDWV